MDLTFNKNEDFNRLLASQLEQRLEKVALGGGKSRIEKEHEKGKLTARERIEKLLDPETKRIEIGALAGEEMYSEHGGCPGGGVVVVIGYVCKRQVIVVANDATVKAGAWFPITAKKNLRAQEIAMENRLPIIYLVDSAGVYLPLQDEVFADKEHFGRIFRNNAILSSMGILQIAAIMGSCVAGGAYLPIMSDEALIVDKTGSIFLAGSFLVKAAIGESIDNETLGGATTHSEISGVTDYKCLDDDDCLNRIRNIMDKVGDYDKAGFDRVKAKKPAKDPSEIFGILPDTRDKAYDMREIIDRLVDDSSFEEYKEKYGQSILTGLARIDGWAVGIVANQPKVLAGCLDNNASLKAARFVRFCDAFNIPIITFVDVPGFLPRTEQEYGGIIKHGAKLLYAYAEATVPKITVITRKAYGGAYCVMASKQLRSDINFTYPSAEIAVMGPEGAVAIVFRGELQKSQNAEAERKKLVQDYEDTFATPYKAAELGFVDEIIFPETTRPKLIQALEMLKNKRDKMPPKKHGNIPL